MGASLDSRWCSFDPTDLRQRLHQVGHHLVPVLGQDVVQRGSPLAVLPQHEEAGVLLIGRRRRAVVLEVLHRDAAEQREKKRTDAVDFSIDALFCKRRRCCC